MGDDLPRRPFDHHVEPLFEGLGVEQGQSARSLRRRVVARNVLLALGAAALILWWLA